MPNINLVVVVGRLAKEPQALVDPRGITFLEVEFAVGPERWGKRKKWERSTIFFPIIFWRRNAELAQRYLRKGSEILVRGYLTVKRYKTKSGERRRRMLVTVERFQFMGPNSPAKYRTDDESEYDDGFKEEQRDIEQIPNEGKIGEPDIQNIEDEIEDISDV